MKVSFKIIIASLIFFSCSKKVYDKNSCNEVSMKCYRGFPRSCNELETKCKNIEITYTKEKCQKALGELVLGSSLKHLEGIYGKKVVGCFNKNDLDKFSVKETQ